MSSINAQLTPDELANKVAGYLPPQVNAANAAALGGGGASAPAREPSTSERILDLVEKSKPGDMPPQQQEAKWRFVKGNLGPAQERPWRGRPLPAARHLHDGSHRGRHGGGVARPCAQGRAAGELRQRREGHRLDRPEGVHATGRRPRRRPEDHDGGLVGGRAGGGARPRQRARRGPEEEPGRGDLRSRHDLPELPRQGRGPRCVAARWSTSSATRYRTTPPRFRRSCSTSAAGRRSASAFID